MSVETILCAFTHARTHTQAPTHTSILTISSLIYMQLKTGNRWKAADCMFCCIICFFQVLVVAYHWIVFERVSFISVPSTLLPVLRQILCTPLLCAPVSLHLKPHNMLHATVVTRDGMDTKIRVSTES